MSFPKGINTAPSQTAVYEIIVNGTAGFRTVPVSPAALLPPAGSGAYSLVFSVRWNDAGSG